MKAEEPKKRRLIRLGARVALPAFALLAACAGDHPPPATPAAPVAYACPDKPEAGDYRLGRMKRFTLLPPLQVVVTGYSSTPEQTDSTPFLTASMTQVRPGVIALSRDLIRTYNPKAPFRYGDRVRVEGIGEFIVEDTMHERYQRRADIWFESVEEAVRWGRKMLRISLLAQAEVNGTPSGSARREASAPSG
ncbi:MAG: hypothetical protein ABIK65_05000 [Candidatus Eisenbacteria bacterium]